MSSQMRDRQVPMYIVVILLPILAIVVACWIMMDLGPLSTAVYFAIVAIVSLAFTVETIARNLPRALSDFAEANCYRFDGTKSARRATAEVKALRKLRSDLWAIGVLCLLVGGMAAAAFHFYVIPIPVAARGLLAFDVDPQKWKSNMKDQSVDRDLEGMLSSEYRVSPRDANKAARSLWQLAPVLLGAVMVLGFATVYLASRGYRRALAEYHRGLRARASKAAERDILHIQHQEERQFRQSAEANQS